MEILSYAIKNGIIDDRYGKRGSDFDDDIPALSIPFNIHDAPAKTVSFAAILEDLDAIKVVGYPWIHWLIVNLKDEDVPENASRENTKIIQGKNSWGEDFYGGMVPPDAPHRYDLHVYALDTDLALTKGFDVNDLRQAMDGHIIEEATLSGIYKD